ncbi:MAG: polysulfide reductase NrfD [Candidatus Marinimicrobia bacterium]|nr:polysulfide reductase NrfD [Candidatus Neomarinimicrobiota bacterium]MBT3634334.1 polysulfide reductase NrfD [Candidatus Neomarinimicrobiota bacterium]MBT3681757.1 polysulfide reductase NrfD [Candidatus Neomarinimicrobiota bacterium]MBT3759483.1 polysulfide reductase NrfD [Candidatus Neomarinimicrobiota bacterium]MBT3895971.1 polysulfide reductase NrfD [Candidatus Neomarinimicrobiota bacterium]
MIEEIITSGRMNHEIDPQLHIWGWEIPLYLFLGGLVAGILILSGVFYILGREERYPFTIKILPIVTPLLLSIGLFALFLDLSHKLYFWRLYTIIRWNSPMSWGAWTLMAIFPLSILWSVTWLEDLKPQWFNNYKWLHSSLDLLRKYRQKLAMIMVFFSLILGMYTGILLSAFNARPFWNTAILGPLFLVSGLSGAAALVVLFSKETREKKIFGRIDLLLITIEIFLLIHLFMGFLSGTQVHIEAAKMFLGGPYTTFFWVFIMGFGLVFPGILEFMELRKFKVPTAIPAILVLIGGLLLRIIIVDAGQASRWLY